MGFLDWIESLFAPPSQRNRRSKSVRLTEMILLQEAKSEACSTAGEATQERFDPNEKPSCRAARRSRKIDDEDYSVLAGEHPVVLREFQKWKLERAAFEAVENLRREREKAVRVGASTRLQPHDTFPRLVPFQDSNGPLTLLRRVYIHVNCYRIKKLTGIVWECQCLERRIEITTLSFFRYVILEFFFDKSAGLAFKSAHAVRKSTLSALSIGYFASRSQFIRPSTSSRVLWAISVNFEQEPHLETSLKNLYGNLEKEKPTRKTLARRKKL
ncbi:hypothetical protein SCHPADRAFT_895302 [Schizopora paradoxa]|uniref:Uncharacterized protein n=1 Tax=Schizopora paradoxa TaxID=27342 RepID=A0A0H2RAS3_9AGAM|nr:hypothetical protein SCHPADRAFT_895302 [Schizopora paradoxa]